MERMTAGLSIRTRYLAERYPYQGETYTFIVRGNGFRSGFHGKSNRRKRKIQTANLYR